MINQNTPKFYKASLDPARYHEILMKFDPSKATLQEKYIIQKSYITELQQDKIELQEQIDRLVTEVNYLSRLFNEPINQVYLKHKNSVELNKQLQQKLHTLKKDNALLLGKYCQLQMKNLEK